MQKLRDVVDIFDGVVAPADHPLRVAVAAQVGRNNVVVTAQVPSDPIPVPAMVATAVHQQHGRRLFIAPVDVVKPQALGKVDV